MQQVVASDEAKIERLRTDLGRDVWCSWVDHAPFRKKNMLFFLTGGSRDGPNH
jgi:hypothetical protein